MKKSAWKKLKLGILKIIGQNNANRLSLMQKEFTATIHRCVRKFTNRSATDNRCSAKRFSVKNQQTFFGYYDISPFSEDNRLLLAMTGPIGNRPPTPADRLQVGYFDIRTTDQFHSVGTTSTWCWQQGCRLRWYPANENNLILYNKMVNDCYGSVVQNVFDRTIVKKFDFPIYDIQKTGARGLTLNFSRLGRLRPGYGYINLPDTTIAQSAPKDDGIWIVDLDSGNKTLLLSLHELSLLDSEPSMANANHYVNHISISPYDDTFMCFHLWIKDDVTRNRLVVCRMNRVDPILVNTTGMFSHYTWTSANELMLTIFHSKNRAEYIRYDFNKGTMRRIDDEMLAVDGHPTWSPDGKTLLTDTYPDKFGEQSVITYTVTGGANIVRHFPAPISLSYQHGGEVRCDLHPRWDRAGRQVCVDSAAGGQRSMYVLDIGGQAGAGAQ